MSATPPAGRGLVAAVHRRDPNHSRLALLDQGAGVRGGGRGVGGGGRGYMGEVTVPVGRVGRHSGGRLAAADVRQVIPSVRTRS